VALAGAGRAGDDDVSWRRTKYVERPPDDSETDDEAPDPGARDVEDEPNIHDKDARQ
jgi:hypothetical protein